MIRSRKLHDYYDYYESRFTNILSQEEKRVFLNELADKLYVAFDDIADKYTEYDYICELFEKFINSFSGTRIESSGDGITTKLITDEFRLELESITSDVPYPALRLYIQFPKLKDESHIYTGLYEAMSYFMIRLGDSIKMVGRRYGFTTNDGYRNRIGNSRVMKRAILRKEDFVTRLLDGESINFLLESNE